MSIATNWVKLMRDSKWDEFYIDHCAQIASRVLSFLPQGATVDQVSHYTDRSNRVCYQPDGDITVVFQLAFFDGTPIAHHVYGALVEMLENRERVSVGLGG